MSRAATGSTPDSAAFGGDPGYFLTRLRDASNSDQDAQQYKKSRWEDQRQRDDDDQDVIW